MLSKQDIIEKLGMAPHQEGGYFVRTYESARKIQIGPEKNNRHVMTSIYYMLTDDSPVGYLHKNQSDIMHYYHHGSPLKYLVLHPDGKLEEKILGNDLTQGQKLQLLVPGGCWKATQLIEGEYGLLSEAVAPGFDYDDHVMAEHSVIKEQFPDVYRYLQDFIK